MTPRQDPAWNAMLLIVMATAVVVAVRLILR